MVDLRDIWEATSFQLERLQINPQCAQEEEAGLRTRRAPGYKLSFEPVPLPPVNTDVRPKSGNYTRRRKQWRPGNGCELLHGWI